MSSPDDRVGLLQEAEPMDYGRETSSANKHNCGSKTGSSIDQYGSQRGRKVNVGSIHDAGSGRYSTGTGAKTDRPPKGLFDDI